MMGYLFTRLIAFALFVEMTTNEGTTLHNQAIETIELARQEQPELTRRLEVKMKTALLMLNSGMDIENES